jgi:predicted GNAT family N-acyltransferase
MRMKIIEAKTQEDLKKYYDLRYEVLRKPWNQSYASTMDDQENETLHYLVVDGEEALATGRLQFNSEDEAQVRSMSVRTAQQGKGLGSLMVRHLEDVARATNRKHMVLDSRDNAVKFYESLGYKVTGKSYLLFGLIQHYKMEKEL